MDLSGTPCMHDISYIHFMKYEVLKYLDSYYNKAQYVNVYNHAIHRLNGSEMWVVVPGFVILPPTHKIMPGRSKRNRKRDVHEEPKINFKKLSRKGVEMTC